MTNIQQHIGIVFFFRTFELYRSKSNENFFINILTMSFSLLFIFPFVLYRSKSNENFFIDTLTNDALFQLSFIQTKRIILDNVGIVYIFPYNYLLFFLSYFIDPNNEYSTTYWNFFFFFVLLNFIDPNQTKTFALSFTFYFPFRTLSIQIERKQLFDNIKSHSLYAFIPTIVHSHFSFDLLRFLSYRTKGKGRTRTSNKDWALSQCLLLSYRIFVSKESGEKIK